MGEEFGLEVRWEDDGATVLTGIIVLEAEYLPGVYDRPEALELLECGEPEGSRDAS
jgi:hypothetical protein